MTNIGLVNFARSKIGTPYVYGCKQIKGKETVLTLSQYKLLKATYGTECVWDSDVKKVGKICTDCSGLISWYTGKIYGSSQYKSNAKKVHDISTIKTAPIGVAVWMKGHIGIYTGLKNGIPYYIAEDGSAYGCREVPLSYNKFTHWFKISDIDYIDDTKEIEKGGKYMITNKNIEIFGKLRAVKAIEQDGFNFVKLQDFNNARELAVTYDNNKKLPKFELSFETLDISANNKNKVLTKTINVNGTTFVSLREIIEACGGSVDYDVDTKNIKVNV